MNKSLVILMLVNNLSTIIASTISDHKIVPRDRSINRNSPSRSEKSTVENCENNTINNNETFIDKAFDYIFEVVDYCVDYKYGLLLC
ncbi:hypothetical protein H311_04334, partial [Anncaliia algerae PRA109]